MKVAVVGARGFVGSHILRVLRAYGVPTRAVVRARHTSPPDPDQKFADALDVYALRAAFTGCDHIVLSVLGDSSVILGCLAPVYAAAEAVGAKRLIYISTGSVHGQSPSPGTDESSQLHTHHAFSYNNAKVRAERRLRKLRRRGSVELVMLRPTIVFGPGSRWVFDFGFGLRDGTAYVVDGARGICNSIYVDNLAHAVWLSLAAQNVDGESFLVGDRETVTWADLYRAIADGSGYDFGQVPSYSPPHPRPTLRQRFIDPIRSSDFAVAASRHLPPAAKELLKGGWGNARSVLRRIRASPEPLHAAEHRVTGPVIPDEIILLQRCQWRLPNEKASRLLGYTAPVSFADGCARSIAWLQPQMMVRTDAEARDSANPL